MTMRSIIVFLLGLALQSPAQDPRFDVVSIRPSDPDARGMNLSLTPGGGLRASGVTLRSLIVFAYDVRDTQISGIPGWGQTDRFDILATSEGSNNRPEDVRKRTQAMLAERFRMVIRLEDQERPVYFLTQLNTGHKMKNGQHEGGISRNRGLIAGTGAGMKMMSVVLAGALGRPVIDRTGLEGKYNFTVGWTEEASLKDSSRIEEQPDNGGPSIFTAIREQLGLRLDSGRSAVPVIVVEKVEKPTAN